MANDKLKLAELDTPENVLKRFMKEHFDFAILCKAGFFTKDMKNDYQEQARRICKYYGYKTVYEYGKDEIVCHLSYTNPKHRPEGEGFITVIPSIWD